jgi:disulfide bond formation protein DsbB
MIGSQQHENSLRSHQGGLRWTLAALVVSVVGAAGSLWLSIGMGLKACPLCLYQRTFILAIVGILVVGLFSGARHTGLLNALALPAAMGGLGVALFHEFLELTGKLECPAGFLGVGTAPQQSLATFAVLSSLLAVPLLRKGRPCSLAATVTGVVLGVLFALATIESAPPMPAPPDKPYVDPLEVCRPPYYPANEEVNTP